jgi:hypothetical protein
VQVDPDRLPRWFDGFAQRHGTYSVAPTAGGVHLVARDGALAECHAPPGAAGADDLDAFVADARAERRFGLLLARRGAVAVGVASGAELVTSKVDSWYVQGRTAAGGWSQQRFARRRDNQARAAAGDAAGIVARVLLPAVSGLATVVAGGDRRAVDAILADPRLVPVAKLRDERLLSVGEPRLATLRAAVAQARAVWIRVLDPPPAEIVDADTPHRG